MSAWRLDIALWFVAVGLLAFGAVGALSATRSGDGATGEGLPSTEALPAQPADDGDIASSFVEHDAFRLVRHPSPVIYRPELDGAPPPPPVAKPPHPALSVSGILGGPPWAALVDGIPGREGSTLVHAGDVFGGLTVRSVTADSVTIVASDTTWRLGIRRGWQ